MFDKIGTGELIIILIIALFVIGPNKLPEVAKSVGKFLGTARKYVKDITDEVKDEMGDVTEDIKDVGKDLKEDLKGIDKEFKDVKAGLKETEMMLKHPLSDHSPKKALTSGETNAKAAETDSAAITPEPQVEASPKATEAAVGNKATEEDSSAIHPTKEPSEALA